MKCNELIKLTELLDVHSDGKLKLKVFHHDKEDTFFVNCEAGREVVCFSGGSWIS